MHLSQVQSEISKLTLMLSRSVFSLSTVGLQATHRKVT